MPPTYFPLRWESTGDQWWYASPIDYAAANGHYDLVRELLRIDSNHLMKLTSLRRIRRLETVWDDESQFHDVAACRSRVARKLFLACDDPRTRKNTLIRAGYGGWLMYTAASAGDLGFVHDLLDRNPLLVFGEGEYGVTDMLYAAARSKNGDVFRLVYEFAVRPRFVATGIGGYEDQIGEIPEAYRWEMKNRALHAAARGGNLTALKELLLGDCSGAVDDVLAFRDKNGSTILHAAAAKGQTQVVQELVASFDIINSIDNQGNTALHLAAFRGHAATVEAMIAASPSLITAKNNSGDTFLHTAVLGFQTPSFQRLDRHREFMNRLTTSSAESSGIENVVNCQNNEGRTALHMAISGNVHLDFVEMLMLVKSIDVNIRDCVGMTPLDLLRQKPRSLSSDLLIRRLVSAGGIFTCQDRDARRVIASHLKNRGNLNSPGTCFRIPDAEIFLCTGLEVVSDKTGFVPDGVKTSSCSIEMCQVNMTDKNYIKKPRNSSVSSAAERLKSVFHWPRRKDFKKKAGNFKKPVVDGGGGGSSCTNITVEESKETHVPLRQRFSKHSPSQPPTATNNSSNKRTLSVRSNQSSPAAKKKRFGSSGRSRSNSFSKLSFNSSSSSSLSLVDLKQKGIFIDTNIAGPSGSNETADTEPGKGNLGEKQGSVKRRLKSHYFCFGATGLSAKTPVNRMKENSVIGPSVIPVA